MDLESFTGIKLFPGEQVLDVQREHWLIVALPIAISFSCIAFIAVCLILIITTNFFDQSFIISTIFLSIAAMSFLINFSMQTFMKWFYQFYVITSKRLAHIHYFRFGGFHLDEIFHQQITPLEIDKNPQNFIFDFIGIEDVYVYFRRLERPEPFVFRVPQNAEIIEELLERHTLQKD